MGALGAGRQGRGVRGGASGAGCQDPVSLNMSSTGAPSDRAITARDQ